ncbi:MAG TPA: T9SS type A sorting domain-containing protein [Ferruginibacter sp.]|nr:T9SS type A sorting domain-containing protein [Ferruginibacter sp.]
MKKFVFLFLTLSGICKGFAQKPSGTAMPDSVKQIAGTADRSKKNNSIPGIIKPSVRLYPNPATNRVEIEVKGFEPGFVQVQITDNGNQPVREEKRLVLGGTETIVLMFSLKPGIYFLAVKQDKKQARSKLIIQ